MSAGHEDDGHRSMATNSLARELARELLSSPAVVPYLEVTGLPAISGEASDTALQPCLQLGQRIVLPRAPGTLLIGRGAEAGLRLDAPSVSREHCWLYFENHGTAVVDKQSKRGTQVGKEAIGSTPRYLQNGDELTVGEFSLRYVDPREFAPQALQQVAASLSQKQDSSTAPTATLAAAVPLENDRAVSISQHADTVRETRLMTHTIRARRWEVWAWGFVLAVLGAGLLWVLLS